MAASKDKTRIMAITFQNILVLILDSSEDRFEWCYSYSYNIQFISTYEAGLILTWRYLFLCLQVHVTNPIQLEHLHHVVKIQPKSLKGFVLAETCRTTVKHCDENIQLLFTHSSRLHLHTYRKCVCAIVLPHLQQGHHHFMEFVSRQNPITVYIEHFEANCWWRERDARNILLVSSSQKPTGTLFLIWRSNVFPFLKYISNFKVHWQCWGRKEPNDTSQEHFHIHSYRLQLSW